MLLFLASNSCRREAAVTTNAKEYSYQADNPVRFIHYRYLPPAPSHLLFIHKKYSISCSWVGFIINIFYPVFSYAEIYLGGGYILMSKKFLQGFEVGSVLYHVYRKGISQCMRWSLCSIFSFGITFSRFHSPCLVFSARNNSKRDFSDFVSLFYHVSGIKIYLSEPARGYSDGIILALPCSPGM